MKRIQRFACLFLAVSFFVLLPAGTVSASQTTSYTYTLDEKGYYIRTQDAYLPDKTITELGLSSPEDLFIDTENMLYIADAGNRRIVKYDIDRGLTAGILTYEKFSTPKGVYVTQAGDIYVADAGAKMVFRFDRNFQLLEEFSKPETPIFADTNFEPGKIAVDNSGNLYLVGEGVYNGIIQLAHTGEFLGYFTVNQTRLTLAQAIQKLIFTRAQLESLVPTVPTTFSNIFIDQKGVVYTTTMGNRQDGLKKHNTAGGNMFKSVVHGSDAMTDVYVDQEGIIYVSATDGYIEIYSPAGELIFEFGSFVTNLDVAGLFSDLPAIAVDKNRNIWAVDGEKGYLQSFTPTDYAQMVYGAMGLYEKGLYEESMKQWSEVLRLNQMSVLAHNGVGKALLRAQKYEEAMVHFKVAGNRTYYSEAFWEVRNTWLQSFLPVIFFGAIALVLLKVAISRFDKQKRLKTTKQKMGEKLRTVPILKDVLYAFRIPTHPIDRYYDVRVKKQGTVLGATILYGLFFVVYLLYQTKKGFIYQYTAVEDMDINAIVIGFFVLGGLFIVSNFLVTSINEGDGSLKQVYMIPAYGCIPAMIAMLIITVCSYGLTYNESFLLTLTLMIGTAWSLVSIYLGLMTVHDYSMKEMVKSLILTAMFMIIAAVMTIIITIICEQFWQFLSSIGRELVRNVFH